ncbi:DUF262 domain-containing protein [Kocuria sp. cx-116]|uniref:GmrSD restriction endonuclease domain-containing protein n=1 Tax=Kocuria sp. cx-116 TaxID=2771378 RepID=UPI0016831FC5|nr:DUF262 domain-containing protein [Kocuria sp. cx-116]MBD2763588.1 DUF262 domain-containing protein [Kocuria sp. cx-116]
MKSFDSRVYSVNDYREWEASGQLELSPRFQRRSVWTDIARSYLMDTIIRGKPVPKIFLRQKIDASTGRSMREVVDGQQRLRTILAFLQDGLVIRRSHNRELGGLYFSQLDEDVRLQLLNYELSTDLLINVSDEEVLDIFSRLNSHAVVLNQQEKINASHFGEFKQLADTLAHRYFKYWVSNKIITDAQVMRMQDVSFTADLLIAMCDGIQSKKQIGAYYDLYEEDFPHSAEELENRFHATISAMVSLFPEGFSQSEFHRVHLQYSLFTTVYHLIFGLEGMDKPPLLLDEINPKVLRFRLDHVDQVFAAEDHTLLPPADRQFLNDSRRATTDTAVRERRTAYLTNLAVTG